MLVRWLIARLVRWFYASEMVDCVLGEMVDCMNVRWLIGSFVSSSARVQ